jgi:hypothetical protein
MPDPFAALWHAHRAPLLTTVRASFPDTPRGDVEAVCRDLYLQGYERPADMAEALLWLARGRRGAVPRVAAP